MQNNKKRLKKNKRKKPNLNKLTSALQTLKIEGGTVIERQNEIDRLKRQKAKIERDIEQAKEKRKEYANTIKEREKAAREVECLPKKHDEKQKMNTIEARLNRTKPLEEIEEEIETLKRKIEEDRRIMNDENSSRELKQAAAVCFSENTD